VPIRCKLQLGRDSCISGEAVACSLLLVNTSDTVQALSRPEADGVHFTARGPDRKAYSVEFKGQERSEKNLARIPLRPRCSIQIQLGSIVIRNAENERAPVPTGKYTVVAVCNDAKGLRKALGKIAQCTLRIIEYPFRVTLEPSSHVYPRGKGTTLTVRLENLGKVPVQLMNVFSPYKHHFDLQVKKSRLSGSPASTSRDSSPFILSAVSPDGHDGWIIILPGESLSVEIDASKELEAPGVYRVSLAYQRSILLLPCGKKPRYTKQFRWVSNEVEFAVLPTDHTAGASSEKSPGPTGG